MLQIVPESHPALHRRSDEVPLNEITSARIQTLIQELSETLAPEALGVAIAAPQVGEALRIFIISGRAFLDDPDETDEETIDGESTGEQQSAKHATLPNRVFINPVITRIAKKRKPLHEGCLSLRGKWGMVPRAQKLSVVAYDEHGKKFTLNASGLPAHIIQHEVDHLEGILYTEKAEEMFDEENDA